MAIRLEQLFENNRKDLEKYQCPRCNYLLRDPVQQMCCGHWLCDCCAKELAEAVSPRCPRPECQEPWNKEEEPPYFPDRFVRKSLGKFSVKCGNNECNWIGTVESLSQHQAECAYRKTQCLLCLEWLAADEVKTHESVCLGAMTLCCFSDLGCDHKLKMTREKLASHLTEGNNLVDHLELIAKRLKALNLNSISRQLLPFVTNEVEKDGVPSQVDVSTDPKMYAYTRNAAPTGTRNGPNLPSKMTAVEADGPNDTEYGSATSVSRLYNPRLTQDALLHELAPHSKQVALLQQFVESKAEVESLKQLLTLKDADITRLQGKVGQLEKAIQSKSSEGEDRDFRLSLIENINYDGTMIWKIPQFSQRMEDARSGKYTSIFSLPFYSGRYGYKMCLRLYILGDGIGKNTHMSLFFVVMKGEFDAILQWPFTHKVSFRLINQHHGRDIVDVFQPDPLSSSFQRPKTDMNVASGCPRFISLAELNQGGFIEDNTIFIKVKVDVSTIKHP